MIAMTIAALHVSEEDLEKEAQHRSAQTTETEQYTCYRFVDGSEIWINKDPYACDRVSICNLKEIN